MKKLSFPEELPEGLGQLPKELPFRIPDHYFEDFQSRLQAGMETEEPRLPEKRPSIIRYLKPVIGIAAAFALVFMLVFYPVRMVNRQIAQVEQSGEMENIINLTEQVDDHTFFNLLENNPPENNLGGQELEVYIASNYSDLDIYLETQK